MIESCLRSGKLHMIEDLLSTYFEDKNVPETTLAVIIKGTAKQNKVELAIMYQNQLLQTAKPE